MISAIRTNTQKQEKKISKIVLTFSSSFALSTIKSSVLADGCVNASSYIATIGTYGEMVAMGVLGPGKVTRSALQNAASMTGDDAEHRLHSFGTGLKKSGGRIGGMGGMDGMM
jgi:chaperonin GroEL (HSP60 family)